VGIDGSSQNGNQRGTGGSISDSFEELLSSRSGKTRKRKKSAKPPCTGGRGGKGDCKSKQSGVLRKARRVGGRPEQDIFSLARLEGKRRSRWKNMFMNGAKSGEGKTRGEDLNAAAQLGEKVCQKPRGISITRVKGRGGGGQFRPR